MRSQRGFSLAEMAIVMVIVGLLIGGLLAPLSAQMDQRNFSDTQRQVEYARELLLGFAIANGRLPCPASSSSGGDEAYTGTVGACTNNYDGYLPAKALGMQPTDSSGYAIDAFNNRIRYALSMTATPVATCTYSPPFSVSLNLKNNGLQCLPSDLLVCSSSQASGFSSTSCGTNNSMVNQKTVVAIVYSMGKNGASTDTARLDELANADGNAVFISHTPAPSGATGGEFDDQMVWISAGLLFGRMVSAGVLP